MKRTFVALIALVTLTGTAFAAAPETIKMKKEVSFDHKAHVAAVGECKKCHEKEPGKIDGFGKEYAHKNCRGCHNDMKKGPTSCKGCHK